MDDRLRVLSACAGALGLAHSFGITHGDLHPRNVALGPLGQAIVMAYEVATLRPYRPRHRGEPLAEYIHRHRDAPPPPLTDLPDGIASIIAQALGGAAVPPRWV